MDSDKRKDLGWGGKCILNINWGDTASSGEEKEEHPEPQITKVPTHPLEATKEWGGQNRGAVSQTGFFVNSRCLSLITKYPVIL